MDNYAYYDLPLYQECQQKLDREGLGLTETIQLNAYYFKVPEGLAKTLSFNKIVPPISLKKLKNLLAQPEKEIQDTENFWSLTYLEKQILQYYMNICEQDTLLEQLNREYDNIFTSERIHKLFQLDTEHRPWIYYIHQSEDIQPNDCVFINIPKLSEIQLKSLINKINTRIDYQCNSILHKGQIEIYGVIPHIVDRLKNMELRE